MQSLSDVHLGVAVKSARQAADWSAKDLAEKCAISAAKLSKIENGKQTLSFAKAIDICSALGIDVRHLAALAEEVASVADESASIRERLKANRKRLEEISVQKAIAIEARRS